MLVIAGAEDCLTGSAPVAVLARLFPTDEYVGIEGSSHYPRVEQPAPFRGTIDAFLEQPSKSPATRD